MKNSHWLSLIIATSAATCAAFAGTVTGTLQGPSGLAIENSTLTFNLEQAGLIIGSGAVVPLTASCYTSTNGAVVGIQNPTSDVISNVNYGSGSLANGIYYVEITFYSGNQETLPSPELRVQLSSAGTLNISPPSTFPASAAGMRVYIGNGPGEETLQGQTTNGSAEYSQAAMLAAGAPPPATNSSVCTIAFNDTIIPYSGYNVSLISASGNAYPGWPQAWQLNGGLNGIVNISQGAPLWNGVIVYPQPIVAQPLNNGPQSISGSLNMSGYNLVNVGDLGVGTVLPAFPLDVIGLVNTDAGYLYNGTAPMNHILLGNGTGYVDSSTIPANSVAGLYYQTLEGSAGRQPQEPALSFTSRFSLSDTSGASTNVDLGASGATAGSYTNTDLTIDSYGRVTAASSGPNIPIIKDMVITSGICTTTTSAAWTSCSFSANWPSAFTDTGYSVTCTAGTPTFTGTGTAAVAILYVTDKTVSGISIELQEGDANGATATTVSEVDCIGVHP